MPTCILNVWVSAYIISNFCIYSPIIKKLENDLDKT